MVIVTKIEEGYTYLIISLSLSLSFSLSLTHTHTYLFLVLQFFTNSLLVLFIGLRELVLEFTVVMLHLNSCLKVTYFLKLKRETGWEAEGGRQGGGREREREREREKQRVTE